MELESHLFGKKLFLISKGTKMEVRQEEKGVRKETGDDD